MHLYYVVILQEQIVYLSDSVASRMNDLRGWYSFFIQATIEQMLTDSGVE